MSKDIKNMLFGIALMVFSFRFQFRGNDFSLILAAIIFYAGYLIVVLGMLDKE